MNTQSTAAGTIEVLSKGLAPSRGNTTMFLGRLADGRFTVTSRFQYEIKTKSEQKARKAFEALL
jgi:hypothetical protein